MNNRQKIERKIKKEGLNIEQLLYYSFGNFWVLRLCEPMFLSNTKLIETHGDEILRTTIINPKDVQLFCISDLSKWE